MSKDREEIHVGEHLRAALDKRPKESLSTVVNMIAERYAALVERARYGKQSAMPMMSFHAELYCNVLREVGHPLAPAEITAFPAMCKDWLARHPEFPQGPGGTAHMIVSNSSFAQLVALVDEMEEYL